MMPLASSSSISMLSPFVFTLTAVTVPLPAQSPVSLSSFAAPRFESVSSVPLAISTLSISFILAPEKSAFTLSKTRTEAPATEVV